MVTYDETIARRSSGSDPLVPEPLRNEIMQQMPAASAVYGLVPELQRFGHERVGPAAAPRDRFVVGNHSGLSLLQGLSPVGPGRELLAVAASHGADVGVAVELDGGGTGR